LDIKIVSGQVGDLIYQVYIVEHFDIESILGHIKLRTDFRSKLFFFCVPIEMPSASLIRPVVLFLVCLFCVEISFRFFCQLPWSTAACCAFCVLLTVDTFSRLSPLSLWLSPCSAQSTMGMPKCLVLPF